MQGYRRDQRSREADTRYASLSSTFILYMNVLLPDLSMIMTEDNYQSSSYITPRDKTEGKGCILDLSYKGRTVSRVLKAKRRDPSRDKHASILLTTMKRHQ